MARVWGDIDWAEEEIPVSRLAYLSEIVKLASDAVENPLYNRRHTHYKRRPAIILRSLALRIITKAIVSLMA